MNPSSGDIGAGAASAAMLWSPLEPMARCGSHAGHDRRLRIDVRLVEEAVGRCLRKREMLCEAAPSSPAHCLGTTCGQQVGRADRRGAHSVETSSVPSGLQDSSSVPAPEAQGRTIPGLQRDPTKWWPRRARHRNREALPLRLKGQAKRQWRSCFVRCVAPSRPSPSSLVV